MQEITIGGDAVVNEDGGGTEPSAEQSGPTVLDKGALRRYSAWIALVAASSLSYASLAVESANDKSIGARRFSFAVIGISLLVSIGVSGCFIAPDCNPCTKAFVSPSSSTGRFFELFLSLVMLIMWCIGLPIIHSPSNGIAVGYTQVVNANLYLGSWACFGCVFYIVGDLLSDFFAGPHGTAIGLTRLDPETGEYISTAPFTATEYKRLWETRRGKWFALTAITAIAMGGSVRVFQAYDCAQPAMNTNNTCTDSKIGIAMTVVGGILALIMVGIGGIGSSLTEYIEKVGSISTTVVWTVALGVITFGEGPGHSLGNLFFATWGGWITSVMITADCFKDSVTLRAQAAVASDQIELPGAAGVDDSDI